MTSCGSVTVCAQQSFPKLTVANDVNLCVDAEESVKTGRLTDRLAVELLIAKTY